jgi:L-lysine exporter family protein LysE/ArgO
MHLFFAGILLGLGVAIPLGPINVEIIRRNLLFGTRSGLAVALGATSADTTYILLVLGGILVFLNQPDILRVIGILGALVLCWFAYKSFTAKPIEDQHKLVQRGFLHTWLAGYLMTLLSPMTIIFWSSISSQIAGYAVGQHHAVLLATLGVIVGTLCWSMSLNAVLHFTRHKISQRVMRGLNIVGGVILFTFAGLGLLHSFIY